MVRISQVPFLIFVCFATENIIFVVQKLKLSFFVLLILDLLQCKQPATHSRTLKCENGFLGRLFFHYSYLYWVFKARWLLPFFISNPVVDLKWDFIRLSLFPLRFLLHPNELSCEPHSVLYQCKYFLLLSVVGRKISKILIDMEHF